MIPIKSTFCIFYQKDHEDRERNLDILLHYLLENYTDLEIIILQQFIDKEQRDTLKPLPIFKHEKIFHHRLTNDTEYWNKMTAYNFGLKYSTYDIIFYNDVDTIFNPKDIKEAYNLIKNENKILIPSGTHFIDVKVPLIEKFKETLDYNTFLSDFKNFHVYENELFRRNNTGGPGGGLAGKKETFISMNGFNPNFKGWGYEDDETRERFSKLGHPVEFLIDGDPIFHMEHEGAKRGTAMCKYMETNKQVLDEMRSMSYEQVKEYSFSWKL